MEIIDSDDEQTKTEYLCELKNYKKKLLQQTPDSKKQIFDKFIGKFTKTKFLQEQDKKITNNSFNIEKSTVYSFINFIKKTFSNFLLLPVSFFSKTKNIISTIGENIDQIVRQTNNSNEITKKKNNQEIFKLLQTFENVPTEKTNNMITYSDEELNMLYNVTAITRKILTQTISQQADNTLEFLDKQIDKVIKILKTQKLIAINNICNIDGFERDNIIEHMPISRYLDTLKNTIKQYKNSSNNVVFYQPFKEIKKDLLEKKYLTQAFLYQINTNDLWVEDLLKEICNYNKTQFTKENFLIFQIVACVLASTHLAMYNIIKEKDIELYSHKFIQSIC